MLTHIYQKGKSTSNNVYILLHGTGGDEHSLLEILNYIESDATYVSFRGDVNEGGMNRFFKRTAEGVYDVEDLEQRSHALHASILQASEDYGFNLSQVILVGFSNGSNIGTQLMLHYPSEYKRAVLMAPLFPVNLDPYQESMEGTKVFISAGKADPICSVEDSRYVIDLFESRGAQVTVEWTVTHQVTVAILDAIKKWLAQ